MSAEKRSVSAPEDLLAEADARMEDLGYTDFSKYIQALIRADVLTGGPHLREVSTPHTRPASPVNYRKKDPSKDTQNKIQDIVKRGTKKDPHGMPPSK